VVRTSEVHVVGTLPHQDAPTGVALPPHPHGHGGVTGAAAVRCGALPLPILGGTVAHGTPTLSSHSSQQQRPGGSAMHCPLPDATSPRPFLSLFQGDGSLPLCQRCMGCLRPFPRPNPSILSNRVFDKYCPIRD